MGPIRCKILTYPLFSHISNFYHDGGWVGSQKCSNLDLGWVKSMPGDFGEFTVNIGLGINFLAGGTLFLNSNDTLSYAMNIIHVHVIIVAPN